MFGVRTVLGLPFHVLVVHFAVVLVPLAALGLIVTGWKAEWRRRYAFPVASLALVGGGAAFFAAQSGGPLRRSLRTTVLAATGHRASFGAHPGYGNLAQVFAVLFAGAAIALWATERWGEQWRLRTWAPKAFYAAGCGLGVIAIATMVLAGHSGAALVWKDLGNYVSTR